jgi:anthranilate synthase component 2
MLLMIDNYDSFTYNLVQYFGELGAEVQVFRNDAITVDEVEALKPSHIVLSPGPCTPNEAGICLELIERLGKNGVSRFPILGVCLGHQSIGQAFGGKVIRARQVMHGKTSAIHHHQQSVFHALPSPLTATRYHSLIVDRQGLPADFEITAWTQHADGSMDEIMGLRHRSLPIEGVQFHPESILTEHGHAMLKNFLSAHS